MVNLIKFSDQFDDFEGQTYGIINGYKEVICLCCGSTIEKDEFKIERDYGFVDLNEVIEKGLNQKRFFTVCIDAYYVRDGQILKTDELSDDEFENISVSDSKLDEKWTDFERDAFVCNVEAKTCDEAVSIAAEKYRYDKRILYAIEVK